MCLPFAAFASSELWMAITGLGEAEQIMVRPWFQLSELQCVCKTHGRRGYKIQANIGQAIAACTSTTFSPTTASAPLLPCHAPPPLQILWHLVLSFPVLDPAFARAKRTMLLKRKLSGWQWMKHGQQIENDPSLLQDFLPIP